jgi:hypothetical protein
MGGNFKKIPVKFDEIFDGIHFSAHLRKKRRCIQCDGPELPSTILEHLHQENDTLLGLLELLESARLNRLTRASFKNL